MKIILRILQENLCNNPHLQTCAPAPKTSGDLGLTREAFSQMTVGDVVQIHLESTIA